jgi:hypothetical protein
MSGSDPLSPYGLPTSPRANRQMLSPLSTSFPVRAHRPHTSHVPRSATPTSGLSSHPTSALSSHPPSSDSEKTPYPEYINTRHKHNRRRSSLIFVNATVPLSPSSTYSTQEDPFEGLKPRKRSALGRFFCCFGKEERARRRVVRETQFEKVGEVGHWTEV